MPETSKPNESPRFPAADDESFLLKLAERLVEDSKSQFIIPSDVNSLINKTIQVHYFDNLIDWSLISLIYFQSCNLVIH